VRLLGGNRDVRPTWHDAAPVGMEEERGASADVVHGGKLGLLHVLACDYTYDKQLPS
jgi:hypothetical protein